ncbi:hypothetical protein C1645_829709 [Glomus cerebriforme]|uniref:Ion transport domain-containing protein n=1 Tax=Glomus cerebriforme TaxID=658196 RepID=A0A397SJ12_9GLOM|nr:hypothetical protein C1645_829709 [Glomus cerebriforme]
MSSSNPIEKDDIKNENKNPKNIFGQFTPFTHLFNTSNKSEDSSSNDLVFEDTTNKKEDYQIAICQNGKFAVTFDTANLRIKILKNTDYRQFEEEKNKKKVNSNESDEINKTIAYFKINDDFSIEGFYKKDYLPLPFNETQRQKLAQEDVINIDDNNGDNSSSGKAKDEGNTLNKDKKFRWSFDISNMQHENENKYFIFVAISHIDVDKNMKGNKKQNKNDKKLLKKFKKEYETIAKVRYHEKKINVKENICVAINMPEFKLDKPEKGTVIYRIELEKNKNEYILEKVVCYFREVSGICKFVEGESANEKVSTMKKKKGSKSTLRRFIVLNFCGIHNFDSFNFKMKKKFYYPKIVERELDYLETNCMDLLLSCIYNNYFLVEYYKNNVQLLEVYNLAKMKIETTIRRVETKDKHIRQYNNNTFSISKQKLQFVFTRGLRSIKMYFMENGLEVASKKFDKIYKIDKTDEMCKIEKIHLLEFIESDERLLIIGSDSEDQNKNLKLLVWDMYNTGKVEKAIKLDNFITLENLTTCLARTSGNILQIDNTGKVTSILKKVDKLKRKETTDNLRKHTHELQIGENYIYYDDESNKTFKSIVDKVPKEPWVTDKYERHFYCLHQDKKETLQLTVGRSTVQIWHQIHSDPDDETKKKENLPNKGEPFLEYIWTNGIPVNQEREKTRLRIKEFKHGGSNNILNDFYLEVYWYERSENVNGEGKKDEEREDEGKYDEEEREDEGKEDEEEREDEGKEGEEEREDEGKEGEEEREDEGKEDENDEIVKMEIMERKTKIIRRKDIGDKVNAIRHACKALEHLNKRTKYFVNYVKKHRYEEMVAYINHIIWRFIIYKPDEYRLLDVRHNVMKNLILGDCDHLIKFILFGDDEENNKNCNSDQFITKHIPRSMLWKKNRKFVKDDDLKPFERDDDESNERDKIIPSNDMELAIYHCKGRELKDTIIVAYLLEYYSRRAIDHAGWMITVSKALPLLFKYDYDDYIRKLFRKECFAKQDHFSAQDPYEIIPEEHLMKYNRDTKFRAFRPIVKLNSNKMKWSKWIYNLKSNLHQFICYIIKSSKFLEDFVNDFGKPPLALRVVPLPEFTISNIPKEKEKYDFIKWIKNIFWFIFIPRWYKIGWDEKNKLSPFSRVVMCENNDDMYDNPATEAIIDFLSWTYLIQKNTSENLNFRNFLVTSVIIFYYLAIYILATEFIQLCFHTRRYFVVYNLFDVLSVVIPVVVMSLILKDFQFSNSFGSVETADTGLVVGISLSIFVIWIEAILYLRLISSNYKLYEFYYLKKLPIINNYFSLLVVIIAFAHTMFFLLKDTDIIPTKDTTFHGVATNSLTNQELNITMQTDFDPKSRTDNPFSSFPTAIMAAYFWLNGNFVQRDEFDFWAVEVFSLIASVLLVTILQNLLIAFMGGVYEEAATKGRQALLRFRANQIANYEALHHIHFWPHEPDPKYIYYIGQSKNFEEWYKNRKNDQGVIYKDFEEKSTFTRNIFKESDYDKFSIWKYEEDTKVEIEKIKNMKNVVNVTIEYLINNLKQQKHVSEKIDNIEAIEKEINYNIESIEKKIKEIENM